MNGSLLWIFLLMLAGFVSILPTVYYVLLSMVTNLASAASTGALLGLLFLCVTVMYLGSLGFGTLAQMSNCGGLKDIKRVAVNAGVATAITLGFLLVPTIRIPWLHDMISRTLYGTVAVPGTQEALNAYSMDMGFWGAWGAAYGFAVGGTLAATC
jgi:hypothetical protein